MSGSYLAERGILRMSIEYYFSGDCTNSAVQDEIKTLFITRLSESPYKDACLLHANECNVDNVQVLCGQAARKKRSESSTLWIDFDITATFEDATFTESFSKFRAHQTDLINKIAEAKTSGSLNIDTAGGGVMEATGIGNAYVILKCPENMLPSYRSTSCVQCAEGTFYDKTSNNCEMCPKGTYQPIAGQSECLPCPPYRTTKAKGSQHLSQCEDGCEPGSWSPSGTSQCSLCAVGTFSDAYGKTKCTSCPGSKSTIAEGANNIDQCKDFDLWLTDVSSETSADFSVLGFKDTIITFWFQRDISSHIFRIEIMDTDKDTVASYMTFGSEIKIGKQGDDRETYCVLDNEQWHSYHLRHSNESTELYVDGKLKEKSNLTVAYTGNMTISLKGKGMVSRLNIWTVNSTSFTRILNISQKCDVDETGDLLKWKAFEFTLNDNIFKQSPSECDDVDSCISSPCLNGECRDILGGHECHCYYGFSGDNCEENIDDCIDHACENNATCVDGAANYTCQCQYGYKGELCEIAIVDGSWGDWGEWSSCSVTCGNGTQQRSRICNDPAPDDGGLACPDNSTQIRTCSEKTCPECNVLKPLQNAIWTCSNHSDSINCTIKCAAGYDFDHEVKPFYFCGKDTFYQWDFQTDDNPDAKLPFCSEIKDSQKLKVFYAVKYKDLECESSDISEEVEKDVNEAVQLGLNNIECVSTGVCHKERVTVTDCNRRHRRSALASTAGIDVSLSCDPTLYGTQTCYTMLSDAMNELHALAMNQTLDIDIKGNIYEVNSSSALADSSVSCSSGMIPVRYYCIPCAPGRYFKNEECVKCDYGSYQVSSGQLLCEKCPDDTTTPGRESRSVAECSVKLHNDIYEPLTVVAGVVGGVIFLVLIVTTLLFRRCMVKSKNKEENVHFYPKSCSDSDTPTFDKRQKLQSRLQSFNSVISQDSNHGRHTKGYASSTASSGFRPQSSMSVIKRTYVDDNNIEVIDVM